MYFSINMKNVFIIIFLVCSLKSTSQNNSIEAQFKDRHLIDVDDFIGYDNFGSYYFSKNNVFYKNNEGKLLQYQNLQLGTISKIDIINPLKIIVFYKDFNSVVLLDNQLNEIQKINFSEIENSIIVSAIGMSGQNKLWLFNETNQQIALFDLTTNQVKNLNVPIKEKFLFYQTDFNYFNWINSNKELETCNIFGRVFLGEKIETIENLKIINNNTVLYTKGNIVFIEDFSSKNVYQIVNIENSFKKIFYKDQILTIFTNHEIINYKINIP